MTMTASTGGYKKVLNTETHKLTEQTYTGQSSSQMIRVVIDLLPPTHCATTDTCAIGDRPPVDVGLETDNSVSNNVAFGVINTTITAVSDCVRYSVKSSVVEQSKVLVISIPKNMNC